MTNNDKTTKRVKTINHILETLKRSGVNVEDVSDGYHTFQDLYDFRKMYNAALFKSLSYDEINQVHKSKCHADGEPCFGGGSFIVVAVLPTGQISNHYELKDWDIFDIPEFDKAQVEFDGHTPEDVLERLKLYATNDY